METSNTSEPFTIFQAGPFNNLLRKLKLDHRQGLLALICILGTWVPLMCLTLYDGTFNSGVATTFLTDFALHSRLLLAMPMLILIRPIINKKATEVIKYIATELLPKEEQEQMREKTFPVLRKLASSFWTDLTILIIVAISAAGMLRGGYLGITDTGSSTWMISGAAEQNQLSSAGIWAMAISLPLFQFLLIRWLWRYLIWTILLYQFSSKSLILHPSHGDRSGGLGILVLAQRSFNMVFMACSIVVAGQIFMRVYNDPAQFQSVQAISIGVVILGIILVLVPLVFFLGKLLKAKQRGLLHYSYLSAAMSQRFELDWFNTNPIEKRIEERQVDPSMAYDYSGMFDNLQQMRVTPITLRDIVGLAIPLAIPFVPILFLHFSAIEILQTILKIVL